MSRRGQGYGTLLRYPVSTLGTEGWNQQRVQQNVPQGDRIGSAPKRSQGRNRVTQKDRVGAGCETQNGSQIGVGAESGYTGHLISESHTPNLTPATVLGNASGPRVRKAGAEGLGANAQGDPGGKNKEQGLMLDQEVSKGLGRVSE
jgi:hypothetical protein